MTDEATPARCGERCAPVTCRSSGHVVGMVHGLGCGLTEDQRSDLAKQIEAIP